MRAAHGGGFGGAPLREVHPFGPHFGSERVVVAHNEVQFPAAAKAREPAGRAMAVSGAEMPIDHGCSRGQLAGDADRVGRAGRVREEPEAGQTGGFRKGGGGALEFRRAQAHRLGPLAARMLMRSLLLP